MFDVIKEIVISEKEFTDTIKDYKNALVYIKNNLIDSDDNMYLIVDSFIEINNIITASNNIKILREVNIRY